MGKYDKMKSFFRVYRERIFNKKNIVLAALLLFLLLIYLQPIKKFSIIAKCKSSPWVFPFLVTDTNFLMIYMTIIICFFSNVPFMNRWNSYYLLRSGKDKWIKEQICYIAMSATMITIVSVLMTWIVLIPQLQVESDWGRVLYTLSKTNARELCGLFWTISAQFISKHSAIETMLISLLVITLGITFLGMLMLWCSLFLSRSCAVVSATVLVANFYITTLMGDFMQKKMAMVSPVSWMEIANYGVTRYGYKIAPSIIYTVTAYSVLIAVMSYMSCKKIRKIDFLGTDEEWK